jgi:hypothetical protein
MSSQLENLLILLFIFYTINVHTRLGVRGSVHLMWKLLFLILTTVGLLEFYSKTVNQVTPV